jgi:thiamine monophosphate kinase
VDPGAVPRPPRFAAACARLGLDPERLLLTGGEDYELLFTVRGEALSAARLARRLGVEVSEIGRVVPAGTGRGLGSGRGGWRHF